MQHGLCLSALCFRDMGPVSLSVGRGECVGMSGPSGAGKTLLLRVIADMDPHTGKVFWDGAESHSMQAHEWRSRVGLLPTESAWWHDTVGPHFRAVDTHWLELLGFGADVMTWSISRLSGGERQRLALLRLLSCRPAALLLDEPTANLDPERITQVEMLIRQYQTEHKAAVVWVSHDQQQLRRVASRCFHMENHRLVRC